MPMLKQRSLGKGCCTMRVCLEEDCTARDVFPEDDCQTFSSAVKARFGTGVPPSCSANSIEELGISIQQLGMKAFPGKDFDRLLRGRFYQAATKVRMPKNRRRRMHEEHESREETRKGNLRWKCPNEIPEGPELNVVVSSASNVRKDCPVKTDTVGVEMRVSWSSYWPNDKSYHQCYMLILWTHVLRHWSTIHDLDTTCCVQAAFTGVDVTYCSLVWERWKRRKDGARDHRPTFVGLYPRCECTCVGSEQDCLLAIPWTVWFTDPASP